MSTPFVGLALASAPAPADAAAAPARCCCCETNRQTAGRTDRQPAIFCVPLFCGWAGFLCSAFILLAWVLFFLFFHFFFFATFCQRLALNLSSNFLLLLLLLLLLPRPLLLACLDLQHVMKVEIFGPGTHELGTTITVYIFTCIVSAGKHDAKTIRSSL